MDTLAELERAVWKRIQDATEKRESARLAPLGALAEEMEIKKRDWIARLEKLAGSPKANDISPAVPYEDFTGRPIKGYTLNGVQVPVKTYKDVLLGVANTLRQKDSNAFDQKALFLGGRKRRYFATDASILKFAHELEGGGLFAETNLNANLIVKICYSLVQELGHPPTYLELH